MAEQNSGPHTPKHRLLVTGIGRSGTGYMAKVLTAAGLECAFRSWYPELMRAAERYGYDDPWKGRLPT